MSTTRNSSQNGKSHTYWRLVRSVRRNGKVRQQIVVHLGELDAEGRARQRHWHRCSPVHALRPRGGALGADGGHLGHCTTVRAIQRAVHCTEILVHSEQRKAKEQVIYERFATRIEQGLASLGRRIDASRKALDRAAIECQIGRLLGKNSRASARYLVQVIEDKSRAATLRLQWSIRAEWDDWSRHSEGCYGLYHRLDRTGAVDHLYPAH